MDRAAASSGDVARIDALLPQTQCTRCGYPGCRPYAAAIASGEAQINQCPPGGSATIRALAELLGREFQPLNPANGIESPPRVAWIDEARCIGCARCLPPCPVDAIVGAAKYLHTVLIDRCTGCELCLAALPGRLHRDASGAGTRRRTRPKLNRAALRCPYRSIAAARAGARGGRSRPRRLPRMRERAGGFMNGRP